MSSPVPHAALPYIQFGTRIYTPNAAADALLDTALQDSHLASTLDHTIDPQSPVGFIHEAYTHHMAMRNVLISLVEHVPHHQEIQTLFTLLQQSDVHLHRALLRAGTQLSLGTAVSQIDALLYDLRTESPTLPTTLHISDNLRPSDSPDLALTQDDEPLPDYHICYWAACLYCHRMSHNKLHCRCYTCLECHISAPSHTLGNCMGPPRSPSRVTSPTGWTSSSDEPTSSPPCYHPYHLRGHPQGIRVKKSQGTSPHPQPHVFSPVNSLDRYDPSSRPSFSPGRNLSPSPDIAEPALLTTMTPPSSPLRHIDSLPPTLWSPDDPRIPILHSIGFTVDGWAFPTGLPTWTRVCDFEQQHLWGVTFNPLDELDHIHEQQHLHSTSFGSED